MRPFHFLILLLPLVFAQFKDYTSYKCPLKLPAFNCPKMGPLPNANLTSWRLHPQQVSALVTFGDSLSAALFSERNYRFGFVYGNTESRSTSWSSGGKPEELTLYNLLKRYNNDIAGGSTIDSARLAVTESDLNFAVSKSNLQMVLNEQIPRFEARLSHPQWSHLKDKYKVINIFAGAMNLCRGCLPEGRNLSTPEVLESTVRSILEKLRTSPALGSKMVVNLFPYASFAKLYDLSSQSWYCKGIFQLEGQCKCILTNENAMREWVENTRKAYNALLHRLADEYATSRRDPQFAVFVQPNLEETRLEEFGDQLLSRSDCFHMNRCGHLLMSYLTFQNMMKPKDQKYKMPHFDPNTKLLDPWVCPTGDSYIQ